MNDLIAFIIQSLIMFLKEVYVFLYQIFCESDWIDA